MTAGSAPRAGAANDPPTARQPPRLHPFFQLSCAENQ